MQILDPAWDPDQFYESLVFAPERVLMLDYDGTIAPFRTDREHAAPYPGVMELLNALMKADQVRLIVVTGREISNVIPLLKVEPLPEIWGSHGMERRTADGAYEISHPSESVLDGALAATKWAQGHDLLPIVEQKPFGVAFHWRGLVSSRRDHLDVLIRTAWESESARYDLILTPFDGGLELRAKEKNKGYVVRHVLEQSADGDFAAYLGDDFTDEEAFAAIKGSGLAVLVRPQWRETTADIWLTPPAELIDFLQLWLDPRRARPDWLTGNGRPNL